MAFWKQLLLTAIVLVAGLIGWIFLDPGAGATLAKFGAPGQMLARLAPGGGQAQEASASASAEGAGQRPAGNRAGGQGRGGNAPLVVTRPVGSGTVNDQLNAIGSGDAIQSVLVMPQATGTISEILVTAGQKVKKGEVLARLDDEEQLIAREEARVALRSASEKSSSYANLKTLSRLDVLDAQIAEERAKLALQTAELNLKRRDIVAPIDGVTGIVAVNIGDNVTTQTQVVTIDDRSEILVDFWAPERFAVAVERGQPVEASSIARPGQLFRGVVEAIDNRVDPASRTMRIRARIDNPQDILRAGMSFNVTMRFTGETYATVDPLAVQWDAEGSYVWKIAENKAAKSRVRIIQRNPDSVLVAGDAGAQTLSEGDAIVIEGLQRVRDGAPVRLMGQNGGPEVASQ